MKQPLDADAENVRYEYGAQVLSTVDDQGGQQIIDALADIAPELAHHVVAFGFGDIYGRPGLSPPQRQLVTIGILTALGGCEAQLRVHINGALNVGLSTTEIVEAITQSLVYCGFPKALNAMSVAKEIFTARNLLPIGSSTTE